jgi:hypothetical protein
MRIMDIESLPKGKRCCAITGDPIVPGDTYFIIKNATLRQNAQKGVFQENGGIIIVKRSELIALSPEQILDLFIEI